MSETEISKYLIECHKNVNQTDYFNKIGISNDSVNYFNLGYDAAYHVNEKETWEAIIIPTSEQSYEVINVEDTESVKRCRRYGFTKIFNKKALYEGNDSPIYVCEDPIDAIYVIQAGRIAISISCSSNYQLLIDELDNPQRFNTSYKFIILFHNNERNAEYWSKLETMLTDRDIPFINGSNIMQGYKNKEINYFNDSKNLADVLNESEIRLSLLISNKKKNNTNKNYYKTNTPHEISAADSLNALKNKIRENARKPKMLTNIPSIDQILDGGLMPWLYIIGGMSSVGKTTLILQIADNLAKQGIDVLIFSLEQSKFDLMSKSISRETYLYCQDNEIDTANAKSNLAVIDGRRWENFNKTEISVMDAAFENYKQFANHVFIYEGVGDIGVEEIRQSINSHIKRTGNKNPIVFIDYLQILKAAKRDKNATDKQIIDHNVTALKQLSRDYDIPVFAISSLNRQNYNSTINMSSFKESGSIEYGADVLMGIQLKGAGEKDFDVEKAKGLNPRPVEMKVLKYRNGQIVSKGIGLTYYTTFNYFSETNRTKKSWQQRVMKELNNEPLPFD